ncbi:zinc finger BED domain-containing protein 4-like [Pygocentrus nattereri]|uniref:zinc finger BED domain-containing protein 4-like n=1 Tax=Pygocentrus nattereri TaxID=42514 RepID=UPI0018914D3C|nr:zinc finger BED domain-containing protein 4-like [Pygocentrus nattereri]
MIVKDLQPLSIVEDQGFQAFVRALDPKYNLPGRKKLTETHLVNMCDECKGKVLSGQHHRSAASDVLIEIHRYSEEKVMARDSDALVWWKEHEPTFPALSKLAVRYMGITATSVPAERVFSKAGEVLSKKRNRLKGKTVNMILFLNKNL